MPPDIKPLIITLKEHEKLYCDKASGSGEGNRLPENEFEKLKDYLLEYPTDDDKPPLVVKRDHLKATNYVGAILTEEGTQIEILPKVDLGAGYENQEGQEDQEDDEAERGQGKTDPNQEGVADKTDLNQEGVADKTDLNQEGVADKTDPNQETRNIFLKMLLTYLGRHQRQFDRGVWGEENLPLLEAFIAVFLQEVQIVVRRGLARTYISHEDNLSCLKGKLDFTNHIRHNLFHKERFYVRFDEFSIDRPINRVIKRALHEVCKITQNQENYRLAHQQLHYFDEVRETRDWRYDVKISRNDRTVNYKSYTESFQWAQIILQHLSPNNWRGERQTISLLFPMEKVFEYYIAQRLEYILPRASGFNIQTQSTKHKVMVEYQDNDERGASFTIIPDIIARHGNYCMIIDTKWKLLDGTGQSNKYGISQGDIYQLYSYGKVYQRLDDAGDNTSLILLYPQNKSFKKPIEFREDKRSNKPNVTSPLSLRIVPVDIAGLTSDNKSKRVDAERQLLKNALPKELWQQMEEEMESLKTISA